MHERLKTYEQRDVQTECLDALKAARESGVRRGMINMATGLGKTYVIAQDVKDHLAENPNDRVLYACHNTDILRQARDTFEDVLGSDVGHGFVFNGQSHDQEQIVYASYQTLNGRDKLYQALNPYEFDYVVDDENHHAMARTHREVLEYLQPKFLRGLSATPERRDGRDIMDIFEVEIFRKTLEEAMVEGLLTPMNYKLYTDHMLQVEDIVELIQQVGMGKLNRNLFIPLRDEEIAELMFDELAQVKNPHGLIYTESIEQAERYAEMLPDAVAIHSKLKPGHERELKNAFKYGEIPIATVVDMYNEGVDVPTINFLGSLRSTTSLRIWLQQIGRGLRVHESKDEVRFVDLAASFERIQMVLDLEDRLKRASRREPSDTQPRNIDINAKFGFSAEARDVVELAKQARLNYQRSRDQYRKPFENIREMVIDYENNDGGAEQLHLSPEEMLVITALWNSQDGSLTTKDLQEFYQQQFRQKIKQKELNQKLHTMFNRRIISNVAFKNASEIRKVWRLSSEMAHLLSDAENYQGEYEQAVLGLQQIVGARLNEAFDVNNSMPVFIDLTKTANEYDDQLRVRFDEPGTIKLVNIYGKNVLFEDSDITGPELGNIMNNEQWSKKAIQTLKKCRVNGTAIINKSEAIMHFEIAGSQFIEGYGEVPYIQFFDRKLAPSEINKLTGIVEGYGNVHYVNPKDETRPVPPKEEQPSGRIVVMSPERENDDLWQMINETLRELDRVRFGEIPFTLQELQSDPAEMTRITQRNVDEYESAIIIANFKDYPELVERVKTRLGVLHAIKKDLEEASWYSQQRKEELEAALHDAIYNITGY